MRRFYDYKGIGPVFVNDIDTVKYLMKSDNEIICSYNFKTKQTKNYKVGEEKYNIVIEDFCLDYDLPFPSNNKIDDDRNEIYKMHKHIIDTYYDGNKARYDVAQYKELQRVKLV